MSGPALTSGFSVILNHNARAIFAREKKRERPIFFYDDFQMVRNGLLRSEDGTFPKECAKEKKKEENDEVKRRKREVF